MQDEQTKVQNGQRGTEEGETGVYLEGLQNLNGSYHNEITIILISKQNKWRLRGHKSCHLSCITPEL